MNWLAYSVVNDTSTLVQEAAPMECDETFLLWQGHHRSSGKIREVLEHCLLREEVQYTGADISCFMLIE